MILLKINNKIITEHDLKLEDLQGCINEGMYYVEGTYIVSKKYKHIIRINVTYNNNIYSILICGDDNAQYDYIKTWKGVMI